MARQTFTQAEVDAILARAIERAHAEKAELTLDDLVQIGGELGIEKDAVLRSAEEVAPEPQAKPSTPPAVSPAVQKPELSEIETWKRDEKKKWLSGVAVYVVVNLFLAAINLMTSPRRFWFIWPLLGWGLAIALSAIKLFTVDDESIRSELAKTRRRNDRQATRRQRREARREFNERVREEVRAQVDSLVERVLHAAQTADVSVTNRRRVRIRDAGDVSDSYDESSEDAYEDEMEDELEDDSEWPDDTPRAKRR